MSSNAEKYNECNPDVDGYCAFERELDELKAKIKKHIEVRAEQTVFTVWRRELLEMIK